ncbi:hypothetical protein K438DRAFT_1930549 [Mycena galopus ATCC 62051]|nr:hypothetical protein K438DRAFT_1930549 [Mycena galopus ATCC 62051]
MFPRSRTLFAHCIQARMLRRAAMSTCRTATMASKFNRGDPKTWHRTGVRLPQDWSCDWANWDQAPAYHHGHMSTKVMNYVWGVTGEVEPLAFILEEINPESLFVFCADGVYYWYSHGDLNRFEGKFADHDDFLRRLEDDNFLSTAITVDPLFKF